MEKTTEPRLKSKREDPGYLEIILGPVKSGKTEALLAARDYLRVNHHDASSIVLISGDKTHDTRLVKEGCFFVSSLKDNCIVEATMAAKFIFVDGANWIEDIDAVIFWVTVQNKYVWVAGLNTLPEPTSLLPGQHHSQKPQSVMKNLISLVAFADYCILKKAQCHICGEDDGMFTEATVLTDYISDVCIVDSDTKTCGNLMPICRRCDLKRQRKT